MNLPKMTLSQIEQVVREQGFKSLDPFKFAHAIVAARDAQWQAALAEQEPVAWWMPIMTAPRDGTEVLAWREDCGAFIALYTSPDAFPMSQDELDKCEEDWLFQKDWFSQWPHASRLEGSEAPTHWMPLPAAPGVASPPTAPATLVTNILKDCCECERPNHWDVETVELRVSDLTVILERHIEGKE